jgi:hypothetical protein
MGTHSGPNISHPVRNSAPMICSRERGPSSRKKDRRQHQEKQRRVAAGSDRPYCDAITQVHPECFEAANHVKRRRANP